MGETSGARISGMTASLLIAKLTFKRLFRSKTLIVSGIFCLLPIVFASSVTRSSDAETVIQWRTVFGVWLVVLAIVPPLHLAPTVAEEVENKTFTYLWSRPFPRWSLIVGKLLALTPVLTAITGICMLVCYNVVTGDAPADADLGSLRLRSLAALAAGVLAIGCVSVGIGSLIHKQALVSAVSYVFILDLPIGALPFALRNLAVTHQVRKIAAIDQSQDGLAAAVAWLLIISAIWMTVALWRVTRAEYATDR